MYLSLNRQGYIDYIRGKFETIKRGKAEIVVEKGSNEIGKPAVVMTQGGERIYLTIDVEDGKIRRACLMPFLASKILSINNMELFGRSPAL